ncbi:MAG: LamG domain-containing protein, partial [Elusimicrobia bacterium]|nr:LamG domain-containing protein [Elusimicrobiota bacterium]
VTVPDNLLLEPAASFTVEGLVFSTATQNPLCAAVIGKDNNTGYSLELCPGSPTGARLNASGSYGLVSGGVIPSNRWVHVAAVYDAVVQGARLYIDGQFVSGVGGVAAPSFGAGTLFMGARDGTFSMYGAIDEVRLWSIARTTAAIQADMRRTLTGGEIGLAGLWSFDAGSGAVAADSTINGLNGTLVNSPLWVPDAPRGITDLAVSVVSTGLARRSPCPGRPRGTTATSASSTARPIPCAGRPSRWPRSRPSPSRTTRWTSSRTP